MFGRRKDGLDGGRTDASAREPASEAAGLRPTVRPEPAPAARPAAAEAPRPTLAESSRPAPAVEPRRAPDIGSGTGRRTQEAKQPPLEGDAKRLIVGRGIVLTGEIRSCDRLVVEGRVEASLADSRSIEIAESGSFTGTAQVESADVSGLYEGEITIRGRLTVRSTGRITGTIHYGELEIERGGILSGTIGILSDKEEQPAEARAGGEKAAAEGGKALLN